MKVLIRNIIFTLKKSFIPFAVNIVIHSMYGILPVLAAYLWKILIDYIQRYMDGSEADTGKVLLYVFIYCASYGVSVALPVAFELIDTLLRNSIKRVAQTQIHNKMDKIPYQQFEDAKTNDYIVNSSQTMVNGIFMYFSLNVTYFISDLISLISSMILLSSYAAELLLVYPILILPVLGYGRVTKLNTQTKLDLTPLRRKKNGYEEYVTDLQYAKDTRVLNCADYFLKKRTEILNSLIEKELKSEKKVMLLQLITSAASALAYGVVLAMGIFLMYTGRITVAEYASMISLVGVVNHVFNRILDEIKNIPAEKLEIESGFKLLDMEEGNYHLSGISADQELSVDHVSFRYPLGDRDILSDINLQIHNGQIAAFVGENGAGKSTLAKVILGLYEPTQGKVCYDHKDISGGVRAEVFALSSAAFEDYNKYALTVEENIALADEINPENLQKAVQLTGADKIILKFDAKEKAFLGKKYGGADLSGGEWQKLALARGYYKESRIVILDEPTASLDPIAEYNMYRQFKEICKDKIGIIITHRLPAASIADYIYYINKGKITEEGTHTSLINQNGEYAKIYALQKELFV